MYKYKTEHRSSADPLPWPRDPDRDRSSPGEHQAQENSTSTPELRKLAQELRALALRFAPDKTPTTADLVTDELFAASQAAGYRVAEDPFTALLGLSLAVRRSALHRKSATREVSS